MVEDAQAAAVVVEGPSSPCALACGPSVPCVMVDAIFAAAASLPSLQAPCGEGDLCFVQYTSGSTGRPKGVRVSQRAMHNRFAWQWVAHPFAGDEVCLSWTSPAFVDHYWEMFGGLGRGVPLVFAQHLGLRADLALAIRTIQEHRVSRLVLVPSLLRELLVAAKPFGLLRDALPDLRYLSASGEALPTALLRSFLEEAPSGAVLLNIWGTTEVAADVTAVEFRTGSRLPQGPVAPIGTPIPGTQVRLLDPDSLSAVPEGEVGELFVCGACLAEGYLNRPKEEQASFVALPDGARAFRTGDFGHRDQDGLIWYRGRRDQQVKINGQRVEVLEVEQALQIVLREGGNTTGAVVALEASETSGSQLTAFVTAGVDVEVVRAKMQQVLPPAWVPTQFLAIPDLPRLPTGKVDKQALKGQAQKARTEGRHVEVVDSMGGMRLAGRETAWAVSALHSMNLVAIVPVILSHWMDALTGIGQNAFTDAIFADAWLHAFHVGFGAMEGLSGPDPALGARDAWLLALWASWPYWIPQTCGMVSWLLSGGQGYPHGWALDLPRWFILWMLVARLSLSAAVPLRRRLVRACERVAQPQQLEAGVGLLEVSALLLLAWIAGSMRIGLSTAPIQFPFEWRLLGALPAPWAVRAIEVFLAPRSGFRFGLAYQLFLLALCRFGFLAGAPALRYASRALPRSALQRAPLHLAALALALLILWSGWGHQQTGYYQRRVAEAGLTPLSVQETILQNATDSPPPPGCTLWSAWHFACLYGAQFAFVCSLAFACAGLPGLAPKLGRHTLAAFAMNLNFKGLFVEQGVRLFGLTVLPSLKAVVPPARASQQPAWVVVAYISYALVFVVFIAQPASHIIGASLRTVRAAALATGSRLQK